MFLVGILCTDSFGISTSETEDCMTLETVTKSDQSLENRIKETKEKIADCEKESSLLGIRRQKVIDYQTTTDEGAKAKEESLKTLDSWLDNLNKDHIVLVAQLEVDELDILTNSDLPIEPEQVVKVNLLQISK